VNDVDLYCHLLYSAMGTKMQVQIELFIDVLILHSKR